MLPKLLAKVLELKCHLRDRLVQAYEKMDLEELVALAGPLSESRLSRLKVLVEMLWKYHRELWMSMYKVFILFFSSHFIYTLPFRSWLFLFFWCYIEPFGWEVLDLRYGGLRARLETMHDRMIQFLESCSDSSSTTKMRLEELEVGTELVYPSSGAVMMLGQCLLHVVVLLMLWLREWRDWFYVDYHRVSRPQYCWPFPRKKKEIHHWPQREDRFKRQFPVSFKTSMNFRQACQCNTKGWSIYFLFPPYVFSSSFFFSFEKKKTTENEETK